MLRSPLVIAASHGQRGSAFRIALTSRRSAAPAPRLFAPAAGVDCVPQITRIGSVHAENTALDIVDRTHAHFLRKHVTERNKSIELIVKLRGFYLANSLDQQLPVSWRAAQAHCFQERDLAAAQINLTSHN